MKKTFSVLITVLLFLFLLAFPASILAQNPPGPAIPPQPAPVGIANSGDIATLKGLEGIFQRIVIAVLGLVAIVLFIYLIYGGISYITSGGQPDKASSARNAITYAIYGVIVVALAYLILRAIAAITGVTGILNFQIGP